MDTYHGYRIEQDGVDYCRAYRPNGGLGAVAYASDGDDPLATLKSHIRRDEWQRARVREQMPLLPEALLDRAERESEA